MNYYLNQKYTGNHRGFVGGMWQEIGNLQFDFLKDHGLKKSDYVLDFGCGSLRLGRLLIPWLWKGRYWGVEQNWELLHDGIEREVHHSTVAKKAPEFNYQIEVIGRKFDAIMAQSVFTHHTRDSIEVIFPKLVELLKGTMYITYFEGNQETDPTKQPFEYWQSLGSAYGLQVSELPYPHPRGQKMLKFTHV